MANDHTANPSLAKTRNRVTNKTRLKVFREGSSDNTISFCKDEDNIGVVSVAGVDRQDANEHHLRVALSITTSFNSMSQASEERNASPCIPTPDSTGAVDNYEDLYPRARPSQHPTTYIKFSDTVEESISFTLSNGFIYYMDERDKQWLEKHNMDARSQWLERASTDQNKKSQASSPSSPIVISDDEYELVMAIFEKSADETPEILRHNLDRGMFPFFSLYVPVYQSEQSPSMFALSDVPAWLYRLPDGHLLRVAQAIYPHWMERRIDRRGSPIMPSVNLDETDLENEAYVSFRRLPSQAVRRSRIQRQRVSYVDKLQTLQTELGCSLKLAEEVLQREMHKRNAATKEYRVLKARLKLIDTKGTNLSLAHENDDELLFNIDPELPNSPEKTPSGPEPVKRGDMRHATPPNQDRKGADTSNAARLPLRIPPRKQGHDALTNKRKDENREDVIEHPYQPSPIPYPAQLFKAIGSTRHASPPTASMEHPDGEAVPNSYAARLRYGRGGLLDDFDPRHLAHRMRLLGLQDLQTRRPDQSIVVSLPNGHREKHIPYALSPLPWQLENDPSHSMGISSSSASDILGQGPSDDNGRPPVLQASPIPQNISHAQCQAQPESRPGTFPSQPFTFHYTSPLLETVPTPDSPCVQKSHRPGSQSLEQPKQLMTVMATGRPGQSLPALYIPSYQWGPSQPSNPFHEITSTPGPSTILQPATFSPTSSPESDASSTRSARSLVMPSSPSRQSRGAAGGLGAGHH